MSAARSAVDDDDVLRDERDAAVAHARAAEHELGAARGRLRRLQRVMWRRTRRQRRMAVLVSRVRTLTRR